MPRVPAPRRFVQENSPDFTPLQSADFGAAGEQIGRAAQRAGNVLANVADERDRMAASFDEARAKDLDTQYAERARPLLEEYNRQQGVNALNAREGTEKALKDLQAELMGKAQNPREKFMLKSVLDRRLDQDVTAIGRYAGEQGKAYARGVSVARQVTSAQDARRFADDPVQFETHLETGLSEIRSRGATEGWGADVVRAEEAEYKSNVYAGIVSDKAVADPLAAKEWLDSHRSDIDPAKVRDLDNALEPAVMGQWADQEADSIRGIASPPGPLVGKVIEDRITAAVPGVIVTSRDRTPEENERVGGVKNSYHLTGQARDLAPPKGMTMAQLEASAKAALPGYQVINEGDHIHVEPARHGPENKAQATNLEAQLAHVDSLGLPYDREQALKTALTRKAGVDRQLLAQREADAYDSATRRVLALGDGFTSVAQLGEAYLNASPQQQATLKSIAKSNAKGGVVKTDDVTFWGLRQLEATNPKAFAALDPFTYRDKLSNEDWRGLVDRQSKALGKDGKPSPFAVDRGRLFGVSKTAMAAAGMDVSGGKISEGDAKRRLAFVDAMAEAQETWQRANPNKVPDDQTIRSWAGRLLVATTEPGMLWGTNEGKPLFEADPDDLVAGLDRGTVAAITAALRRAGQPTDNATIAAAYRRRTAAGVK